MATQTTIYSNGNNTKIGNNVSIINLPPIKTCTNCATCAKSCYANWRYSFPNVKRKWDNNFEQTKSEHFVEKATNELKYKCTPIVRYHESGDFYSEEYIEKSKELAIANPQISFYGYTKNKSALRLNEVENINIIYSLIDTPIGEVRNYGNEDYCNYLHEKLNVPVCPHDSTWKEQGKKCMIDCQECLHCKSMLFVEHGARSKGDKYSNETLAKLKEVLGE